MPVQHANLRAKSSKITRFFDIGVVKIENYEKPSFLVITNPEPNPPSKFEGDRTSVAKVTNEKKNLGLFFFCVLNQRDPFKAVLEWSKNRSFCDICPFWTPFWDPLAKYAIP